MLCEGRPDGSSLTLQTPLFSSPQTRANTAWIFFSMRTMSSRLASTSARSASISATMAN